MAPKWFDHWTTWAGPNMAVTCSVRAVSDDGEQVLEYVDVVRLVEALCGAVHVSDVLQQLVENAQPGVGDVPHRVLQSPDDRVQHQLELCRRNGQERCRSRHPPQLVRFCSVGQLSGVTLC